MIFTIGTSDRTLAGFSDELAKRNIRHLIDVRSSPRSRFAHFNAGQMEAWSERAGTYYRWAGDVLGGRSAIDTNDARYADALNLIVQAANREPVAIFCAEGDPRECHRSYEIAATLLVHFGVEAVNIRRDGSDQRVTETLALTKSNLIPASIRREVLSVAEARHLSGVCMASKTPLQAGLQAELPLDLTRTPGRPAGPPLGRLGRCSPKD